MVTNDFELFLSDDQSFYTIRLQSLSLWSPVLLVNAEGAACIDFLSERSAASQLFVQETDNNMLITARCFHLARFSGLDEFRNFELTNRRLVEVVCTLFTKCPALFDGLRKLPLTITAVFFSHPVALHRL